MQRVSQQGISQQSAARQASQLRELPKQTIKTLDRGEKTVKTAGKAGQTVKNTGKGTIQTAKAAEQSAKAAAKVTASAVKAVIVGTKALISAIVAGGWAVVLILIIVLLFGGILCMVVGGGNSSTVSPVSAEVEAYEPVIRLYANQYGIGEYVELIKAVMMQESGGQGSDPMQSSESGYNTRYPREPNGITNPEYSIECGVQALKDCLYKMSRLNVQKILYKNVQYLYYIFSCIWSDIYLFSYISWLELPLFINSIKL